MSQATILTVLHKDHQKVAQLFKDLEKTTGRSFKQRREMFHELDEALSIHADFEEQEVYSLLESKKAAKSTKLEALEEHLVAKRLLSELRELDTKDERWMAKLEVLKENVSHHVKEEEDGVFSQLRKDTSTETLQELARDYQNVKDLAKQQSTPTGSAKAAPKMVARTQ